MTDLVDAYQRDDIHRYESILQANDDVLADPFIAENIDEVTRNMRTKAVVKLIAPYTRFTLDFIARQLKVSVPEVQDILGFLIVDGKVRGQINQDTGTVEVQGGCDVDRLTYMQTWSSAVKHLSTSILDESEGLRPDESGQSLGTSADFQARHGEQGSRRGMMRGFGRGGGEGRDRPPPPAGRGTSAGLK